MANLKGTKEMKKILFLAESVSLAHVGRPLVLANWAHQNNMDVHFACAEEGLVKTKANTNAFATYPLHTIDGSLFYERVNKGKFFYTQNELNKYVEEESKLIKEINPDLVVSDFRLTSSISASLANKPLLNLSNAYWSPNYSCPFPAPNAGIFKLLSQKQSDFVFNLIRPVAFKVFGKELNQVRAKFGLDMKSDFRKLYTDGTYTAYMDMPDFVNIDKLPENHFYLGPIVWSPELENEKLSLDDNKYVYISMGSTGENAVLPMIIKSILKNKYKIILSGVNAEEAKILYATIPQLKNNSVIKPLIQAEKVLNKCHLTICHGGSGTAYQSLSHGTPVMCFPKNPDQALVAMALKAKNIGRYLSLKNSTQTNIDSILQECLHNEVLKQNAQNYSKKISLWNTENRWVQFLNKFKTARKSVKVIA